MKVVRNHWKTISSSKKLWPSDEHFCRQASCDLSWKFFCRCFLFPFINFYIFCFFLYNGPSLGYKKGLNYWIFESINTHEIICVINYMPCAKQAYDHTETAILRLLFTKTKYYRFICLIVFMLNLWVVFN